mgnify:FL=1
MYDLISKCDFTIYEEDEENLEAEIDEEEPSLESLDPTLLGEADPSV